MPCLFLNSSRYWQEPNDYSDENCDNAAHNRFFFGLGLIRLDCVGYGGAPWFPNRCRRLLSLGGRPRGGTAAEQFASVGQGDGPAVGDRSSDLGTKARDFDLKSGRDRILLPTQSEQRVWRPELEPPIDNAAVRIFYVDIKPCVRVHPFDLRDCSTHFHGPVDVEFRRECVMRRHWH